MGREGGGSWASLVAELTSGSQITSPCPESRLVGVASLPAEGPLPGGQRARGERCPNIRPSLSDERTAGGRSSKCSQKSHQHHGSAGWAELGGVHAGAGTPSCQNTRQGVPWTPCPQLGEHLHAPGTDHASVSACSQTCHVGIAALQRRKNRVLTCERTYE